jgi:hypothetical protein
MPFEMLVFVSSLSLPTGSSVSPKIRVPERRRSKSGDG